jgi:hypothetical protein
MAVYIQLLLKMANVTYVLYCWTLNELYISSHGRPIRFSKCLSELLCNTRFLED